MDRLTQMQLFARVVERGSFSAAATDLGLPRATATEAIKNLERRVGAKLLERTTRHVATTLEGQDYYRRCLSILADIEEAEGLLRDAQPRGRLRIDAHGLITRTFLLPHLPEFLKRYPLIDIHLGQSDRLVDLVREGVDCVIRAGEPADSRLVLRRLGMLEEVTVASPAYLERHGVPRSPDDLEKHEMIGFISSRTGEMMPLEFVVGGTVRTMQLRCRVTVDSSDTMADLVLLGQGIVQAPRYRFARHIAEGRLVELLEDCAPSPTPLSALYPQNRQLAPRLEVFLAWLSGLFKGELL